MIESISKLDSTTKNHVLDQLHKMGEKTEHFIRYSYSEFENLCSFISACEMNIDQREMTSILNNFNNRETRIYRQMLNSPATCEYDVSKLKALTTRTRLAIGRILKKDSTSKVEANIPVSTRLQRLRTIFK